MKSGIYVALITILATTQIHAKRVEIINDAGMPIEFSDGNSWTKMRSGSRLSQEFSNPVQLTVRSSEAETGNCSMDAKKFRENIGNEIRIWVSAKRKLIGKTKLKCEHKAISKITEKLGTSLGNAFVDRITSGTQAR